MQDKGISDIFKKIIDRSSEMVFLANNTHPYSIFYANEFFEKQIGQALNGRNLGELGFEINDEVFKDNQILSYGDKNYTFEVELAQANGVNYFLFHKGKESKNFDLERRPETSQFFTFEPELLGMGKHDHLTYVNPSVLSILGFKAEELYGIRICNLIHEDDLEKNKETWKSHLRRQERTFLELRLRAKNGDYHEVAFSVQFDSETFFVIGGDISSQLHFRDSNMRLAALKDQVPELTKSGTWKFSPKKNMLTLESRTEKIISELIGEDYRAEVIQDVISHQINRVISNSGPIKDAFGGILKFSESQVLAFSGFFPKETKDEAWGVIWDDSHSRALHHELGMYRHLWMDSPEPMLIAESDGKVILANDELNKLFGNSEGIFHLEDLSSFFEESASWSKWIGSASSNRSVKHFNTLLSNGIGMKLSLEIALRKAEINERDYILLSFRSTLGPLLLDRGVDGGNHFLVNFAEQVPGGLFQLVLDANSKLNISFLSKGVNSVLGLSQEDIRQIGDISDLISKVHPKDLPQVVMTSLAARRNMEPWQCQFRVKFGKKSQEYRWVLSAAMPQALENGEIAWYGYLTDISMQKEFETKLDEARLAAEKANQIKSDFLSMISHELRTPLNAISGSVYSLFNEDPTENQKSALKTINFAVDNLIIMINDLLDFQKIEAGKLTIERNPINLKVLMEQVLNGLTFHAKDSKNKLKLHLSEGLDLYVKADKTRLSQVMNNLVTNALKFTHGGNVDVRIELLGQTRNKIRVNFSVTDTGIGIATEHQQKIFGDFDQVKPTFNSKYGGTGLGLSITKKLINLMGGNISLESEIGKGSRFFFDLEFERVREPHSGALTFEKLPQSVGGLHLLMAEDNEVNALVLGKIIKKWGYTYSRVPDGREAVEAARTGKYDCILMDIQMPGMDGFDATLEIKKFSDTPIIALTAAARLEIIERLEECEFDGFVAKPIDAAELLKKVLEVVGNQD